MKAEIINSILADWDPIGVGKEIATDEYIGYVPQILKCCTDKNKLMNCLSSILIESMGLDCDLNNPEHYEDIQNVCEKILQANE